MLVSPQLVDTQHLKLYNTDMKKLLISSAVVLSLLMVGAGAFVFYVGNMPDEVVATQTVEPESKPPTVDELLRLVNEERAKVSVAPLVIDARLNQSAQKKADDMVKNNYFAHVSPVDGREGYVYIKDVMPECVQGSENIRDNDEYINTSQEAFSAWVSSKPHYTAMIDGKYDKTGFGVSDDKIVEHLCAIK